MNMTKFNQNKGIFEFWSKKVSLGSLGANEEKENKGRKENSMPKKKTRGLYIVNKIHYRAPTRRCALAECSGTLI